MLPNDIINQIHWNKFGAGLASVGLKIGCIILFTGTWSNDWGGEGGEECYLTLLHVRWNPNKLSSVWLSIWPSACFDSFRFTTVSTKQQPNRTNKQVRKDTISELMMISSPEGWNTPLTKLLNLSNLCITRFPLTSHNTPSLSTRSSVGLKEAKFLE